MFLFSSGLWGPAIGIKFTISCEFGLLQVKCWCHMFSNMKKKWYTKSKLFDIFWVNVVAKNILLGSLVTQHQAVFAMMSLFEEKYKFSEPNCYIYMFSLLNSTLVLFMWKKSHFVSLTEHSLLWVLFLGLGTFFMQ